MNQEIEQLKANTASNEAALMAMAMMNAKSAVDRAVARGAIPAQDATLKARWQTLCEADPANIELLDSCPGSPALNSGRITKPHTR